MAIDMDNKIRRKMSRHPNILFRRRTFWIRKIIRYALRKFDSSKPSQPQPFQPNWKPFQMHAHQLQLDGFVFIENFLNDSDAELIRKNWPKSRYFSPISPNEDHKTSDKGLVCELGRPLFNTSRSPYLWGLFQMFMNKSFTDEVSALCGDGINRYPYHMLAQNSYWGSGLAPHRDSIDNQFTKKINFIYFVDANGSGWEAGGTAMLRSNSFNDPIFVPENLRNTCLFYFSESELFHGFPIMGMGKFRNNVIAHFCAK